jgi:hypothetical protein
MSALRLFTVWTVCIVGACTSPTAAGLDPEVPALEQETIYEHVGYARIIGLPDGSIERVWAVQPFNPIIGWNPPQVHSVYVYCIRVGTAEFWLEILFNGQLSNRKVIFKCHNQGTGG